MDLSRRKFIPAFAAALAAPGLVSMTNPENNTHPPLIRPKSLQKGDLIAVTSPAGALRDLSQVDSFKAKLESLGFKVLIGETVRSKYGYLAGSDQLRRDELMRFFLDDKIKAIVCMKGGYGCSRVVDQLDYDLIRNHPKILMGFSDITVLINAIHAKTGLITFHGPVGNSTWNDYSVQYMMSVLMSGHLTNYLPGPDPDDKIKTIVPGSVEGELIGGNLSVLVAMTGTKYLPDFRGKILFLEEVKEEPFRIDRMLSQLKLAGLLDQLSGVIIGKFRDCVAEEKDFSIPVDELFEHYFKPLNVPAFSGAMIGHIANKYTLPVGVRVAMNASNGTFRLLQKAVSV